MCLASGQVAAQAVSWPSSGSLSVSYDNVTRGTASGVIFNRNNSHARDHFILGDVSNDGNNVYGKSYIYFNAGGSSKNFSTGEYSYGDTPVIKNFDLALAPGGTRAYADDKVCVQLGWPVPDRCSQTSYVSFSY